MLGKFFGKIKLMDSWVIQELNILQMLRKDKMIKMSLNCKTN